MQIYSKNKDESSPRAMEGKRKLAILKYLLLGFTLMILLPSCKEKEEEDVYPKTVIIENPQWISLKNNFYFRIKEDGAKSIDLPHGDSYESYTIIESESVSLDSFQANVPVRASGRCQKQSLIYNFPDFPYAVLGVAIIDEIELLDYDPYGFLTPPDWYEEEQ